MHRSFHGNFRNPIGAIAGPEMISLDPELRPGNFRAQVWCFKVGFWMANDVVSLSNIKYHHGKMVHS
jgi:hypothetical protein